MNIVFFIGIVSAICISFSFSKPSEKIGDRPLIGKPYPKIFWWVECRTPCKTYMRCFPSWQTKKEMTFPPCGFDAYFTNQSQQCQDCLWDNGYPTTITLTHPMLTYDPDSCQETTETATPATAISATTATTKFTTLPPLFELICQCRRVQIVKTVTVGSSCLAVADKHGACHLPEIHGPKIWTSDKSRCYCKSRPILQQGITGGSRDKKKKMKGGRKKGKRVKGTKANSGKGGYMKRLDGVGVDDKKGNHNKWASVGAA